MRKRYLIREVISAFLIVSLIISTAFTEKLLMISTASSSVKGIRLKINRKNVTKKTFSMKQGKKQKLKVIVPRQKKIKIAFRSNKRNIVSVSKAGTLTAKRVGSARITVTAKVKKKKYKGWVKIKVISSERKKSEGVKSDTRPGQTPSPLPENAPTPSSTPSASPPAVSSSPSPEMPTRVIEKGTKINMHFGDTIIPGILNESDTAKALIEKLPYTVHMSSYSHDFCGVLPYELPYNEDELHYGWLNGDIDYAIGVPYFTILHSDEEISGQYGPRVNIGVITCELAKIRNLSGDYDVLIELVEDGSDSESTGKTDDIKNMKMNVQIGDKSFTATLEDNVATRELVEIMREAPISIDMNDYSGFEKVGPLGRSLTTDNQQTTTTAGDIVLYSGNQIVMFYGSNSWSYTRIGKIDDLSGWEDALGSGSITAVLSLK
ncbi:MAG: Ig-like domain-containing protein [Lachnospiraceae bacterium]|nr:Ig-like domain-containing protein [Lachnospiraceae bacterium]